MKHKKNWLALLLAIVMMFALGTTAFAQESEVGTGSGSITVTNATIGETYSLYKLFDATIGQGDAITYTTTKAITGDGTTWFTTKDIGGGVYEVTAKTALTDTVMKSAEFKTWALAYAGSAVNTAQATETNLKFSKLAYGYYVITSTTNGGAAITVDSANPDKEVQDKNDTLELKGKYIVLNKGAQDEQKVKLTTEEMNKMMDFDLGVKTANYDKEDKVWEIYISDTLPEGMTYKAGTVEVKVGTETINEAAQGQKRYSITYYTDAAMQNAITAPITQDKLNSARAFKVVLPWTSDGTVNGTPIYTNGLELHVTYQAYLDPAKADKIKVDGSANENLMKWGYKAGPKTPQGDDPITEGPTDTTKTYQAKLEVFKYTGNEQALTGAEFTLQRLDGQDVRATVIRTSGTRFVQNANGTYWLLKNGKYTTTDPNTPGVAASQYQSTTVKYIKENFTEVQNENTQGTVVKAYVDDNGKVTFSGLYEGTYKLIESVVPDGYNKAEDIEFTVTFDGQGLKFATNNPNVTLEQDQGTGTSQLKVKVENKTGTTMPSTGGIGTTIFYILGSILVLAAGVVLVVNRRMKRMNNN